MGRKVFLGILAWLPIALAVGLAIYLAATLVIAVAPHSLADSPRLDTSDEAARQFVTVLLGGATVIAMVQLVFSVAFIIDAAGHAKLTGTSMVLWLLGFVFVGELVFPAYWIMYVMKDGRGGAGTSPPPIGRVAATAQSGVGA